MKPYKPKTHYRTRRSTREYAIIDAASDFGPTCIDPSRRGAIAPPTVAAARRPGAAFRRARLAAVVLLVSGIGGVFLGALLALH